MAMGNFTMLIALVVIMVGASSLATVDTSNSRADFCQYTRFTDLCHKSLVGGTSVNVDPQEHPELFAYPFLLSASDSNMEALTLAIEGNKEGNDCIELLNMAREVLDRCLEQNSKNTTMNDIQHWLSAALTFNTDCLSSLSYFDTALSTRISTLAIPRLINALSIVNKLVPENSSPPATDYSDSSPTAGSDYSDDDPDDYSDDSVYSPDIKPPYRRLLQLPSTPSAIVSLSGGSRYSSIQAAVDDAPDHLRCRYIIYIKSGVYQENVEIPTNKTFIMFQGDGRNRTVISGSISAASANVSTFKTATLAVNGRWFLARDITVQNVAKDSQAVALRVDSDMSAFHRCLITGFQDTLYAHSQRQFYRDCIIVGSVDFIFGNAAAVFQNCDLLILHRSATSSVSTIFANGRTDPEQQTGFVCQSCKVTGTKDYMQDLYTKPETHKAYLGRPWRTYARSVYIGSFLDSMIQLEGWLPWNSDNVSTTLGEYKTYGPGSVYYHDNLGSRVLWSILFTHDDILPYSVCNFIQGNLWLPYTDFPYRPWF